MYFSTGEIISIILMTVALTAFIVSSGYHWQLYEAKLLISRQDDEIYELKHWRAPNEGAGPDV